MGGGFQMAHGPGCEVRDQCPRCQSSANLMTSTKDHSTAALQSTHAVGCSRCSWRPWLHYLERRGDYCDVSGRKGGESATREDPSGKHTIHLQSMSHHRQHNIPHHPPAISPSFLFQGSIRSDLHALCIPRLLLLGGYGMNSSSSMNSN